MKKVNKFEGFYEDEESIKMLESINQAANKEYVKRVNKKELKQNRIMMVFVIGSLIFIAGCILYLSHKNYDKNVNECVAKGETQTVCEYKFSK